MLRAAAPVALPWYPCEGVCARAEFEVLDVAAGRHPLLAARLAKGIFKKPGVYPATVRFGNADPKVNSDFRPDVRSLSFSVDLLGMARRLLSARPLADKISHCKTRRLCPLRRNCISRDYEAAYCPNPALGLWSLPFRTVESAEDPRFSASTGTPENQSVSATEI